VGVQAAAVQQLRDDNTVLAEPNPDPAAQAKAAAAGGASVVSVVEEVEGAALAAALGGVPEQGLPSGLEGLAGRVLQPGSGGAAAGVVPGLRQLGIGLGLSGTLQFMPQLLAVLGVLAVFLLWSLTRRRRRGRAGRPAERATRALPAAGGVAGVPWRALAWRCSPAGRAALVPGRPRSGPERRRGVLQWLVLRSPAPDWLLAGVAVCHSGGG